MTPNDIMTSKYVIISYHTPPQAEPYTSYMPSLSQIKPTKRLCQYVHPQWMSW